jgi:hypothetical protein
MVSWKMVGWLIICARSMHSAAIVVGAAFEGAKLVKVDEVFQFSGFSI